ncbi:hypothetical protein CXG81DRAFT_28474 [Caulochytrium protostelioides]|uniref:Uncharacterized protein n=1 Tax=Caulochytrium protostelioides TaxID=1555241 RepID=A0A4P9X139_9FUNG|nr:hypothetical protein CXG81DRAFT_28474 [Caulochytrium protostelioides]|eukprot:RKO98715.1 hypothetical protein CXG81DRAFT_28474 [Caulochytrium protostelioides]
MASTTPASTGREPRRLMYLTRDFPVWPPGAAGPIAAGPIAAAGSGPWRLDAPRHRDARAAAPVAVAPFVAALPNGQLRRRSFLDFFYPTSSQAVRSLSPPPPPPPPPPPLADGAGQRAFVARPAVASETAWPVLPPRRLARLDSTAWRPEADAV